MLCVGTHSLKLRLNITLKNELPLYMHFQRLRRDELYSLGSAFPRRAWERGTLHL
jgi:hypothetical protein